MKNLCFRVIIMMIGVNFSGTMTTPSRKSSFFLNSECQWNGYPLANCSFIGKHDTPVNVSQKANSMDVSFNFFRVLLQSPMDKKEQNIKHVDLKNNPVLKITLSPLVHLHALEILNLSNNALHSVALDLPSPEISGVKHHRSSLRRGFPMLKVLILQRNKLSDIPKGLWKLKSLQTLDLSFNEISEISLSDFHNCLQLENLYLNSNKIIRIHPEAFKNLKTLQVVDLSHNALTTVLPMMFIALELPHLEIDLTGNQWQCDCSVAVLQNVLSESWRQKWKGICNRSIGNEEACWGTFPSSIARETPVKVNPTESFPGRRRARQLEQMEARVHPAEGRQQAPDPAGPGQELGLHRRRARGAGAASLTREPRSTESPDLALAVCLSVFITFFLAFGLGALTRPYLERLWPGRYGPQRSPPDLTYSNEGFYDEVAGSIRHQPRSAGRADPHDPSPQNQNHLSRTHADPCLVTRERLGVRSEKPSRWQCGEPTGIPADGGPAATGGKREGALAKDSTAHWVLQEQGSGGADSSISAAHVHKPRRESAGEMVYDMVAQEDSPREQPFTKPGTVQSTSDPVPNNGSEFHSAALSRQPAVALSAELRHSEATGTGECGPGGDTQVSTTAVDEPVYLNLLSTRQQGPQQSPAGLVPSPYYRDITANDVGGATPSPPPCPPRRWDSAQHVLPANPEPEQKLATPGAQYDLGNNYDSDEGSLFTLSSTDSEDARCGSEETDQKERSGASDQKERSGVSEDEDSWVRKDLESQEVPTYRVRGADSHEGPLEKPHEPHSDPHLCQAHVESASDNKPWILPTSQHHSPLSDEIPSWLPASARGTAVWRYSLKDLVFSEENPSRPTSPPGFTEAPLDSSLSASHERSPDTVQYELDTVPSDRTFKITWDNLGSSQLAFEEGADTSEEFV